MKAKQRIDKTEPYFVHIGYTFANELKKSKRYNKSRYCYVKLKVRPCVQARLNKLYKYWGMSLK